MYRSNPVCLWIVAVCVVGVVGCTPKLPPEAVATLRAGRTAYEDGDDRATIQRMDAFLAAHGTSERAGEAHYYRGLARYRLKKYDAARADLQAALDETDDERTHLAAQVALADLAYDLGRLDEAQRRYAEALEATEPGRPPDGHVRYRLGCVLQRRGKWNDAALQFRRVMHYDPDGELARRSERRAPCRAWTVQAGAFREQGNAAEAAAALSARGLSATVQPELDEDRLLFLVIVGRHGTYEVARRTLPTVRKHRADAFVTTTR
ncbi:MAG: tetratricopeptide repeat protein [Phycisphaerae bacterium]|nr:tetratricopeptide repeat protein [Phycisphaerae bacterium]